MNLRLLAVAGLAITFAPALAQQKIGPCTGPEEACKQLADLAKEVDAAYNKQDAAAVAATYTPDAVFVTEGPILSGRDAIEKFYADSFKAGFRNVVTNVKETHVMGDVAWSVGDWSLAGPRPNGTSQPYHGNWFNLFVRSGDGWKVREDTFNVMEVSHQ